MNSFLANRFTYFTKLYWLFFVMSALSLTPCSLRGEDGLARETKSFLFIGNSFTFRHDLNQIFTTLAAEGIPSQPIKTERLTYGGRDLFRHFELFHSQNLLCLSSLTNEQLQQSMDKMKIMSESAAEPAFYAEYWKNIDAAALLPYEQYEAKGESTKVKSDATQANILKRWDEDRNMINAARKKHQEWIGKRNAYPNSWNYVSLQSWQDVHKNPDTGYIKYATIFSDLAKQQNTTPILYVTAPYSQNATPVTAPIESERALKEVRIAFDLAKKTGALVVPVPLAVYRLQKSGFPMTLRYVNDGHPNQYCAYLTACLFYAAVFNKSPEGLMLSEVTETKIVDSNKPNNDPDGNPLKRIFTDTERTMLQRTAWETMTAFNKGDF